MTSAPSQSDPAILHGGKHANGHEHALALFLGHAAQRPDACALQAGDASRTYEELRGEAEALARHLAGRGVRPGDTVAVCVAPSVDIVVGLLAILRLGAVYVPLDPSHPRGRLLAMLEEAAPSALLIQAELDERLSLPCPFVHAFDSTLEESATPLPTPDLTRDAPAYIFYTSGTTGRPKGVLASHGNLAHYLGAARERYGFGPNDTFTSIARYTFSISLWDLLLPLTCGARLLLLTRDQILDPDRLIAQLSQATVTHLGPSLLKPLLRTVARDPELRQQLAGLRHVSSGGDMVPPEVAAQTSQAFPNAEIYVIYGCTEVACMGSTWRVPSEGVSHTRVGQPFPGVTVRLAAENGSVVQKGEVGEVWFSGPGVVLGYLSREDLNRARFVEVDGRRYYRTGDMGRIDASDQLELLGRQDHQVQIGGIRVELGEIEVLLRRQAGVKDAVVTAHRRPGGESALVAYLVGENAHQPMDTAILRGLREHLPDYMVPATLVWLDALPLNENLKLDRAALPQPFLTRQARAPQSAAEQLLSELLGDVLGGAEPDLDLPFPLNGGTSLGALTLNQSLAEQGYAALPLPALFSERSLAELATRLVRGTRTPPAALKASDPPRLSSAQMRIWQADALLPDSPAYVVPQRLQLSAHVDAQRLRVALLRLAERHGFAGAYLGDDDGHPRFAQFKGSAVDLEVVDELGTDALEAAIAARVAQPFDLRKPPLWRASLFRPAHGPATLLLCFHHILFDEASARVLREELPQLYARACGDRVSLPPMPPLPFTLPDYVESEGQEALRAQRLAALQYFQAQLSPLPPPLDLPTDLPRAPVRKGRGGHLSARLEGQTLVRLRGRAREHSATLFPLVVAAFGQVLGRSAGQSEVVIGTAVENRLLRGAEKLMGCFINQIPLRIPVGEERSLGAWLSEVRDLCNAGLEHSMAPFDELLPALRVRRDPSRTPLMQSLVIFEDATRQTPDPVLGLTPIPCPPAGALTDVTLWVREDDEGLRLSLSYDRDLFAKSAMALLLSHVETALNSIAMQGTSEPARLSLRSPLEAAHQRRFNRTQNGMRVEQFLPSILNRFAQNADTVAARDAQTSMSYAQLDTRSAAVSLALRNASVQPGDAVGVCVPRSVDMLAVVLGVLRAGAGYVPLDPTYPADRLEFMARDAQLRCAVVTSSTRTALPEAVVCIDVAQDISSENVETPPPVQLSGDSLAYMIYTSGSTGTPKGVRVPHRAVANFLAAMVDRPGLSQGDVLCAVTTLSFDISVLELLLPLMAGASVVIASEQQCTSGDELSQFITATGASVLQATPATYRMLLQAGHTFVPGFRALCGGEPLPQDLARQLTTAGVHLWNMYGPTETTVWSSCERVDDPGDITVGIPIDNTAFYVLDEHGARLPRGVPGELYIGGLGVTLGYHARDELNATRFLLDPFAEAPGGRMYRTGDRVRQLADGRYQHMGRLDGQVKVRGHRIELGEIEAAIDACDVGRECAVAVREVGPGDARLVAFIVDMGDSTTAEVRAALGARLPRYMVPQHYVPVPDLPRTNNGKLDRKALQSVPWTPEVCKRPQSPVLGTATEHRVLTLMRKSLAHEELGLEDDFFDMGGHSLLALELTSALQNAFGLSLPLGTLFERPSARQLAALIDDPVDFPPAPIRMGGHKDQPQVFMLLGVHLYRELAGALSTHASLSGVYLHREAAMTSGSAGLPRVEELAAEYVQVIRRAQPSGPYLIGGASLGGVIAYEVAQQLTALGEHVEHLFLLDAVAPQSRALKLTARLRSGLLRPPRWHRILARLLSRLRGGRRIGPIPLSPPATRDPEVARIAAYKRIALQYAPAMRPYAGKTTLFLAEKRLLADPHATRDAGWNRWVSGLFIHGFPAEHLEVLQAPHVEHISAIIRQAAQSTSPV